MFRILSIRECEMRTIIDWYKNKDLIEFEPSYQRVGNVWDKEMKQFFLDSIINLFDIPKLYVHYFPEKNNAISEGFYYAVIDGKQRFNTIFEFIDGKIDLGDNIVYYFDPSIELKKLTYSDLAYEYPRIKKKFDDYVLDVVHVISDDLDKVEEMFARLNEGKPLNNAEKRNAIGGYARDLIVELSKHKFFCDKVVFKSRRFDYYDIAAKLLLLEYSKDFIPLTKNNLDNLVWENRDYNEDLEKANYEVNRVLDAMCNLFEDEDPKLLTKSIIPIYYFFVREFRDDYSEKVIMSFLSEFYDLRKENLSKEYADKNTILMEFDRLNQQGTNTLKSLRNRYEIIKKYFYKYIELGAIDIDTLIDITGIEMTAS